MATTSHQKGYNKGYAKGKAEASDDMTQLCILLTNLHHQVDAEVKMMEGQTTATMSLCDHCNRAWPCPTFTIVEEAVRGRS